MKAEEVKVTFQPSGRSVFVLPGTLLLEAAGRAGVVLQTPCGGRGTCGKCKVRIVAGSCVAAPAAERILPAEQVQAGYRLACQTYVEQERLVIDIPAESRFEAADQILTGHADRGMTLRPVITKRFFRLAAPTKLDAGSDAARLRAAVGAVEIPFALLRRLPGFLRSHDWQGTAVLAGNRLLGLEAGDTSAQAYGVAVDLGTTTVVGTLFSLATGEEKAVSSMMNPQVGFGDDVISRISRVRENDGALAELQQTAVKAINALIRRLGESAGVHARDMYEIVIAGNSTMQQLFCGLDPSALGEMPFVQVFDGALTLQAATLGLAVNPGAEVFVFPQIGGFVGGDTVAGMLAARLDHAGRPALLIDIGTNGEIVLAHDGRFQATSTAAGPAFEGARIVQGMRATAGAIEKVVLRDEVLLNVIGNTRPVGICGTALIDAVAELLRKGIIDETGRILSAADVPPGVPDPLLARLTEADGQTNFVLARAGESASGEPIYLWQKDVRELQLATGAIRAGVNILLRRVGLAPGDLGSVLLAGAFGNFIRRSNARRIGLLPQISGDRIHFIGNAASLGAKLALLSADERECADRLRRKTEHVDLSLDPEFQMEFGMAMMFPSEELDDLAREERVGARP
ncbi:MAG: DUF4445 domain-containing protein [Kiritimatiellae bacterium]|nr:DUF4445 domain-containing protein [Kiritimatiellia bacterium]